MEKVGVCRGANGGVVYHVYDGYFYRNDSHQNRPYMYLHCTTNGCPGRAAMPLALEDRIINNFKMTKLHDHRPDLKQLYISELKESILSRCETEFTPLKQVFSEEIAKAPEEIHGLLTFENYRSTMFRVRKSVKDSLMNILKDDVDSADNSDTEYAGKDLSAEETRKTMNVKGQIIRNQTSVKMANKSKPAVKKQKLSLQKENIALEQFEEGGQLEYIMVDENYVENDCEDQTEAFSKGKTVYFEDGQEYLEDREEYLDDQTGYFEEVYLKNQEAYLDDENVCDNLNEQYSEEADDIENVSEGDSEDENKYDVFDVEHEVEILTSEETCENQKQPLGSTCILDSSANLNTAINDNVSEDLQQYLKFNKTKRRKSSQLDDVLSIFFKEIEATVRSFLPSVIIEAKGKIGNMVHRLEMRNWQVQQELQRREFQRKRKLKESKQKIQNKSAVAETIQNQNRCQRNESLKLHDQEWSQQNGKMIKKEDQENQQSELCPTPPKQPQQETLKQQPNTLGKHKQEPKDQQLQSHKRTKKQQQNLPNDSQLQELQEIQNNSTSQQENQPQKTSDMVSEQDQNSVKSAPVVIQHNPNVSVVYLTNMESATSTPIYKICQGSSLQFQTSTSVLN